MKKKITTFFFIKRKTFGPEKLCALGLYKTSVECLLGCSKYQNLNFSSSAIFPSSRRSLFLQVLRELLEDGDDDGAGEIGGEFESKTYKVIEDEEAKL